MSMDRQKEIVRHLDEDDLDQLLADTDDEKISKRLIFVKNLYAGDTLAEAADRVGKSPSTGSRWAKRWNEGGLGQLTPNFGAGRPPKLGEDEQVELIELLREGQPWKSQEIQHLINEKFGVEYHPVYLGEVLTETLGLHHAIPRTKRQSRPDNAEEILDERVSDAFDESAEKPHNKRENDEDDQWVVDDAVRTDGGTVVGFFDASHPQPRDNSHRMYYVDDPHITRPLVHVFEPAVGFYALNGESVVSFPEDKTKERICGCFERILEQNPGKRILLVLDNHFAHTCEYTRKRAHQLGIDNLFEQLTNRMSFAKSWIDEFLGNQLQKIS